MQHVFGGNARRGATERDARNGHGRSRMRTVEPVRGALAQRIEFHALHNLAAVWQRGEVSACVEKVWLEHLELERQREPIFQAPWAPAHQALARFDDGAHDELLEAGQVASPISIDVGALRPRLPRLMRSGGHDAPPPPRDRHGRQRRPARVVAHQVARGCRELWASRPRSRPVVRYQPCVRRPAAAASKWRARRLRASRATVAP